METHNQNNVEEVTMEDLIKTWFVKKYRHVNTISCK